MGKRIEHHKNFTKHFDKRIRPNKNLHKKFIERYALFLENKNNPILDDHPLRGRMQDERAISITGDCRLVYIEYETYILLLDVGTHNQVYQ